MLNCFRKSYALTELQPGFRRRATLFLCGLSLLLSISTPLFAADDSPSARQTFRLNSNRRGRHDSRQYDLLSVQSSSIARVLIESKKEILASVGKAAGRTSWKTNTLPILPSNRPASPAKAVWDSSPPLPVSPDAISLPQVQVTARDSLNQRRLTLQSMSLPGASLAPREQEEDQESTAISPIRPPAPRNDLRQPLPPSASKHAPTKPTPRNPRQSRFRGFIPAPACQNAPTPWMPEQGTL